MCIPKNFRIARWLLALLALLALGGCNDETSQTATPAPTPVAGAAPAAALVDKDQVRAVEWDDLMPIDWQPEPLLEGFDADELSDDDPRAIAMLEQVKALWATAPMVSALDGQRVRLPGFIVPLDEAPDGLREFLLVPYFGACIHVPPPPPNQTVRVVMPQDAPFPGGLFETVWVEGRLQIARFESETGDAGYRIDDARVSPYVEE